MKKDHQLIHFKFWLYLNRFIHSLVSNSLWYSIVKDNLKITYSETITHAACKKLINIIAQKEKVITIWDIQAKFTKQAENGVEKAKKSIELN